MARLIESVYGHQNQKDILVQAMVKKILPHAIVFSGCQGVGKFKLAHAVAQMLICEHKNGVACGECGSCVRVAKNQSENFKVISAENSQQIKIDQIRSVLDFLSLSSHNQNRVILIDQAQLLNPQAANSLLKTLEEPFDNVFFILIVPDVRLLMATIKSRAQVIHFNALSKQDLKMIKSDAEDWLLVASRGSAARLFELSNVHLIDKRNEFLKFYESFWLNKEFILNSVVKDYVKDRTAARQIIQDWLQMTRDLIYFKQNEFDLLINADFKLVYRDLLFVTPQKLFSFAQALIQADREIDKVDLTLFFESLWVKYARVS